METKIKLGDKVVVISNNTSVVEKDFSFTPLEGMIGLMIGETLDPTIVKVKFDKWKAPIGVRLNELMLANKIMMVRDWKTNYSK